MNLRYGLGGLGVRIYDVRIWERWIGTVSGLMLVRLTRTQRRRAGWFIAMAYLFCVLAPTLSFALPGSQATPYCLTDEDHVPGMVHVHQDGHAHHHSVIQAHADSSADHHAKPIALKSDAAPAKTPHAADGKCCSLMCVSALPAPLVAMAQPTAPKAVRMSENHRKLTDNTPTRLYRPPNS